jgi:putative hemolysin
VNTLENAADSLSRSKLFIPVSVDGVISIFLIILLLIFSALLTGAEIDYFGSDSADKQKLSKSKRDSIILQNLGKPEKIMVTIMISNLVTNIAIIILTLFLISRLSAQRSFSVPFLLTLIAALTAVILFIGEILPRLYAVRHPWRAARITVYPLFFLEKVFSPLSWIFIQSGSQIERKLHRKNSRAITVSEISQVLELNDDDKIPEDKEILEGIVNFGNKSVSDIMCPRVDVVAVDIKSSFRSVLKIINESGYSRIPVCDESFDHVNGILYIKDLLPFTEKEDSFQWQKLLRPPFFIPEAKKVKDLLEDFQKNKIHMAVVVDEYGGSSGLVTLEDVLEEIVGDITDEFDEDESFYTKVGDKKFIFDGKTTLDKFYKIVGTTPEYFSEVQGDADTLAGLILEISGDIPHIHAIINYRDYRFTIESVTNRRIQKIMVDYS